ncbi:MAG: nitrophenyl compound nitroreductase subunit ArsF family protein [Elusimicrobia bacterium]|nr:nitrophenyl compound nitroreductase subunit ArsF family protein [Elusimicrobiota bacterium]
MKKNIGYGLLAFVAISIAFAIFQERGPAPRPAATPEVRETAKDEPAPVPSATKGRAHPAKQAKAAVKRLVIARYCHGNARCSNCIKIEQYSREAIETGLRKDLDSGRLRFEVVNVEEPANRHYVQDYGLYTKSLVLIAEAGGKEVRHKVLNDVWNRLDDKNAFIAYVKSETASYLKQP